MNEPADAPWGTGRGPLALQLGLASFGVTTLALALPRWLGGPALGVGPLPSPALVAALLGAGLGVALGQRRPGLLHALLPALAVFAAALAFADPNRMALAWCAGVTGLFVLAGAPLGNLFGRLPALPAFAAVLAGALLGGLGGLALTAQGAPPMVWLVGVALPFAFLSRKALALLGAVAALALAFHSGRGAVFTPYHRLEVTGGDKAAGSKAIDWLVTLDRRERQPLLALSNAALAGEKTDSQRRFTRKVFDLPFALHGPGERALVLGGGAGNDVASALRQGFGQVVSVDPDGRLIELGRSLHADRPYDDSRVVPVVGDARAYLTAHPDERFDVVCLSLLSARAQVGRLYTVEGLRAAWERVKDDGLLAVSAPADARLSQLLHEATGRDAVLVTHGYQGTITLLAGRTLDPARVPTELSLLHLPPAPDARLPTDDWPFLDLGPDATPGSYLALFAALLVAGALAARGAWGPGLLSARRLDLPMLFLGATLAMTVNALSWRLGSGWWVGAGVPAGVATLMLLANLFVARRPAGSLVVPFVMLGLCLAPLARPSASALALPVAFAGVVASGLLRRATEPASSLASGLLGAALGSLLAHSAVLLGLKTSGVFVLLCYLFAFGAERLRGTPAPVPAAGA